ncbi:FecR family protein [Galbibacter sp. BG1]
MKELLKKYIEGKTDATETETVENWILSSDKNQKTYNILKTANTINSFEETEAQINVDKELIKLEASKTKSSKSIRTYYKYAAIFIVLLGGAYIFLIQNSFQQKSIPENAITLTLDDGTIKVISENSEEEILSSTGKMVGVKGLNKIVYKNIANNIETEAVSYNTLNVPYGKQFNLELADGSVIYLNAGSRITYPTNFNGQKHREVLISGEAFFEIAKDTLHPFVVRANNLGVQVYGTKFNVSAYKEDATVQTVLVEGSVGLYSENEDKKTETTFLKPGYMATWEKADENISIGKTDVSIYTSWMQGELVFKHMPFRNILKKLERHYNVSIDMPTDSIANLTFTASFNEDKALPEVLETFKQYYGIHYQINNNKVNIY